MPRNPSSPGSAVANPYSSAQSGWYAQAVYQFMPAWRTGYRYDQLEDPYRARNHKYDSVDEIHLARGVGDAFMEAFGTALTERAALPLRSLSPHPRREAASL